MKAEDNFYSKIDGFYDPKIYKNKKIDQIEEWSKRSNEALKNREIPKRIIDLDGKQEVYPKWAIRFLFSIVFILIAITILFGILVLKYSPMNQSINNSISVESNFNNTENNENNFNLQATTEAPINIGKIEIICNPGGCINNNSGTNES